MLTQTEIDDKYFYEGTIKSSYYSSFHRTIRRTVRLAVGRTIRITRLTVHRTIRTARLTVRHSIHGKSHLSNHSKLCPVCKHNDMSQECVPVKNLFRWSTIIKVIVPIFVGTAIYAFGLHMFIIPNQFMEGGVTGVTILLNYMFGLAPSLMTLIINIPLFVIGYRFIGRHAFIFTIIGTLSLSLFLWIMEMLIGKGIIVPFHTQQDYFLATLYAGVTTGIGLGIVFRSGGTTGGADILARIGYRLKGWPLGRTMLWFDAMVIGLSFFYIPREKILYTLVIVFIATRVIDIIQEGAYAARAFTIISEDGAAIADLIQREISRGVTLFPAQGAYSGNRLQVVYCIVSRHEVLKMKRLVRAHDPRAFIIISEVQDVLGEGFREEQHT